VLVPSVKFENGTVKELNHIEKDEFPYKKVFNADQIITMRYTHDPLCFNSFSFKTNSYLKDVMNLNVNKFGIEVFTEKLDVGKTYLEGSYRLFLPMGNSKTFDTTKLVANYKYLNGQRNGLAQIWYESDNGLKGDNPTIEQNYKNDLLHGESRLFFSDGKVALQANFINGYLCGETKTFANGPNFKVYSLDGISRRSTDGFGGVLLVYHINESHKFSIELN
jgi:antitoxin component YwqK of YwqJK toxin-antitoxin module